MCRLGEPFKEISRANRKRLCQLHNVFQSYISFAPFDSAYVIPMQPGSLRKLLLRIAAFLAKGSNCHSEGRFDRSFRHLPMLGV